MAGEQKLLAALPGVHMPVSEVTNTLQHMWDEDTATPVRTSGNSDFRALQMNLILHFGMRTEPAEGLEVFNCAIAFAQRYPCRIIVLCPQAEPGEEPVMESKLFSQCYIGPNLREMCCCEALILGYNPNWPGFLENQVSLWLDADLPIYYWLHRVKADRVRDKYLSFFKRCRRILFDSTRDGNDYQGLDWPEPEKTRDLAWARTLPLRQNIGQLLSSFTPEQLTEGLTSVSLRCGDNITAEGKHLAKWHQQCLAECYRRTRSKLPAPVVAVEQGEPAQFALRWLFKQQNTFFRLDYNSRSHTGSANWSLGHGRHEQQLHIEPIRPDQALAEALFFA